MGGRHLPVSSAVAMTAAAWFIIMISYECAPACECVVTCIVHTAKMPITSVMCGLSDAGTTFFIAAADDHYAIFTMCSQVC